MADRLSTTKVVVVGGGGTMGSSTALHLVRSGYSPANITVLDVYPIPSLQSAGYDLNKIMGIRVRNKPDARLSLEALAMWSDDPLFKPFFHEVGMLDCSSSKNGIANLHKKLQALEHASLGLEKTNFWVDGEEEIVQRVPCFDREQGWQGIFCKDGGWLAAAKAIDAIGNVLQREGVNLGFGRAGTFKQPLFAADGCTCTGIETVDGSKYHADKVILAAGAWTPALIDLEDQCVSKAWVYAHIQLTPDEAARYNGVPVVYDGEYGFFFEPDENGIVKVCDEFPGFSNFETCQPAGADYPKRISVPRSHAEHPADTYPDASEASIRKAIARFLPELRDKPLLHRTMCWCTDTADANLLVCEHPRWKNLVLATGDSGHSFKLLPNIGKHVVALMEGSLDPELEHAWRWRPGGDAMTSRRAGPPKDLADMPGWKHDAMV